MSQHNVINFYEVMPKKYIKKTKNPHYEKHFIKIPLIMIIAGSTGSMKTNTVLNIIHQMAETFTKIVIITRNADEPLYNYLKDKAVEIEIYEGIHHMPDLDTDFDPKVNNLVIFDDLVLERNQTAIEEYAIRCRKRQVSMIYLTQDWYRTPPTIRKNINYLILKKIPKMDDLNRILRDYSLGVTKEHLQALYQYACKGKDSKDKTNFFMIDMEADEDKRFRKNFKPIQFSIE